MSCRLYLITPSDLGAADGFAASLAAALDAGDVACVLLRAQPDAAAFAAAAARLRPVVQDRDVAFLVEDDADLAARSGCDGVHLNDPARTRAARARLGEDAIVGVGCGESRHAAMTAAEAGADYVAFGRLDPEEAPSDPDLLAWWQALMIPPCVALGAGGPEACAALAAAGADFVAVGRAVWADPVGPSAAVRALGAALAEADEGADRADDAAD